jgi:hypothetical protein
MARHNPDAMEPDSAPLADYFWIAGIDSLSYGEPSQPTTSSTRDKSPNGAPMSPPVDATIEEGSEGEQPYSPPENAPRSKARHSRNNSWQRLSRLSNEARRSIQSLDALEPTTNSNRSSITVRAIPASSANGTNLENGLTNFDFDKALMKFANERENFLDDLIFSAGAVPQNRPLMTSRAERLKVEDAEPSGRKSPFGKVGGSIRRKISFRDLSSLKRQNTISRASKFTLFTNLMRYSMAYIIKVFIC